MLAVSGKLYGRQFGPPVPVPQTRSANSWWARARRPCSRHRGRKSLPEGEIYRRSVYVQMRRSTRSGSWKPLTAPPWNRTVNEEIRPRPAPSRCSCSTANSFWLNPDSSPNASGGREATTEAQVVRAWQLAYGVKPSDTGDGTAVQIHQCPTEHFKAVTKEIKTPPKGKSPPPPETGRAGPGDVGEALLSSNRFFTSTDPERDLFEVTPCFDPFHDAVFFPRPPTASGRSWLPGCSSRRGC